MSSARPSLCLRGEQRDRRLDSVTAARWRESSLQREASVIDDPLSYRQRLEASYPLILRLHGRRPDAALREPYCEGRRGEAHPGVKHEEKGPRGETGGQRPLERSPVTRTRPPRHRDETDSRSETKQTVFCYEPR